MTATYDDKTKVTMDKEKRSIGDVKAGDRVTMKYADSDGKQMAKSVLIKPGTKKTETGKPKEDR